MTSSLTRAAALVAVLLVLAACVREPALPPATAQATPAAALTLAPTVSATAAPTQRVPTIPATTAPGAATVPPAPSPSSAPSAAPPAPSPSSLATVAATVPADALLAAPFYLIDATSRQVLLVARDGFSYTQLTFEAGPVLELAVASSGALAYLVGDPAGTERTLLVLDGAGRRELLRGELSGLAISPDGQRVVYHLDNPEPGLIVGQQRSPAGVWSSSPAGPGRPGLVIADVASDGVYDPDAQAWSYTPVGFSPDGQRLALTAFDLDGPGMPGGELVLLGPGPNDVVRGRTCCEQPVWSADGSALLASSGGPGPDMRYGLYRSDARTGIETPLLETIGNGTIPLVTFPHQAADGEVLAFVELAPEAGFSWEYPFRPQLARVGPAGAIAPLSPALPLPAAALWEPGGGGVLMAAFGDGGPGDLLWVQPDQQPPIRLGLAGNPVGWAGAPPARGDCGLFSPIVYQPPASRTASPAVRDLQARLQALGLAVGAVDGFYGDQTRAAVSDFQRQRGLAVSGDVDCATWQALLAAGQP